MKPSFAYVPFIAVLAAAMPAHADVSMGDAPANICLNAAAKVTRSGAALPEILYRDAKANCDAALAGKLLAQDRVATLVNRGTIEAAARQTDAALSDYDAALALRPGMPDVYLDRGTALVKAQRYDEAIAEFDKALALGGDGMHLAYFNRGVAKELSGDTAGAYRDYREALARAPGFKPASQELARFQVVERRVASR